MMPRVYWRTQGSVKEEEIALSRGLGVTFLTCNTRTLLTNDFHFNKFGTVMA